MLVPFSRIPHQSYCTTMGFFCVPGSKTAGFKWWPECTS